MSSHSRGTQSNSMLNLSEKLRFALIKCGVSQTELAHRTNQTQSNLANKILRNDFKLSEYERLVEALGCNLEVNIVLPSGEKL